jgi:hypothetical protein
VRVRKGGIFMPEDRGSPQRVMLEWAWKGEEVGPDLGVTGSVGCQDGHACAEFPATIQGQTLPVRASEQNSPWDDNIYATQISQQVPLGNLDGKWPFSHISPCLKIIIRCNRKFWHFK